MNMNTIDAMKKAADLILTGGTVERVKAIALLQDAAKQEEDAFTNENRNFYKSMLAADAKVFEHCEPQARAGTPNKMNAQELAQKLEYLKSGQVAWDSAAMLRSQAAEIERLTGSELGLNRYLATVQARGNKLRTELDELKAKNEKLEAALVEITSMHGQWNNGMHVANTAHKALKE